jgi:hypothetical protein
VHHGGPKQRHDLVADELVDRTAVARYAGDKATEQTVDEIPELLGIGCLGERGEAGHIGEEHGDELALSVGEAAGNTVAPRRAGSGR